jgi:hypothetical protein
MTNVLDVVFEPEFWRVHADDDEALFVLVRPRANIRQRPQFTRTDLKAAPNATARSFRLMSNA